MKYFIFTLITFIFLSQKLNAQSINQNWYSDSIKLCLKISSDKDSSRIDFDMKVKIKVKGRKLTIIKKWAGLPLLRPKAKYSYYINEITDSSLVLVRLNIWRYDGLEELDGQEIIQFRVNPKGCNPPSILSLTSCSCEKATKGRGVK